MLELIKKNIYSFIIIILLALVLLFNIANNNSFSEMSYDNLKDYANELRTKKLYTDAIQAYEEFLKSSSVPKNTRANIHYFIAEIYSDNLKDFDNALAHYIKIKYIYPDTPLKNNINQKIVECLENSGRSREAQLALEESTSLNKKSDANKSSTILAKIDSDMITLEQFDDWYNELPQEVKNQFSTPDKRKVLLQQFISQELMYRMALRKAYQNDPDIIKKSFEIKKNLMIEKLMQSELLNKIQITQNDLNTYYNANKTRYKQPLSAIRDQVYQDIMREKMQEKSQEMLQKMVQANDVQIYDGNFK